MQGIRFKHQGGKSSSKAALAHPPLVSSTRAAISACGKKRPFGLLAATLRPLAGPPLYPKTLHHSATTPLKYLHTSSSVYAQETTIPEQFSSGNKLIFLPRMTFHVGELSTGFANGIPVAVLQALAQVLVTALCLVPTLLVHSWLTPDSTTQAPSPACSL